MTAPTQEVDLADLDDLDGNGHIGCVLCYPDTYPGMKYVALCGRLVTCWLGHEYEVDIVSPNDCPECDLLIDLPCARCGA